MAGCVHIKRDKDIQSQREEELHQASASKAICLDASVEISKPFKKNIACYCSLTTNPQRRAKIACGGQYKATEEKNVIIVVAFIMSSNSAPLSLKHCWNWP